MHVCVCDQGVGKLHDWTSIREEKGQSSWGSPGSMEETVKHLGLAVGQRVLETHKQKLKMINPQRFETVRGSALDRNKFSLLNIIAQK